MELVKKVVPIALSLALCASMVAPAFAAVALVKEEHIDSESGALLQNSEGNYDYYLDQDIDLDKTLVVNSAGASIDLNGHEIALNKGMVITDATEAEVEMPDGGEPVKGSVIAVEKGGTLTLSDSQGDGRITGAYNNDITDPAGGVKVAGGSFVMEGGTISGNVGGQGGGVSVSEGGSFEMKDGLISENCAFEGGGVSVSGEGSSFTMTGGTIAKNAGTWGAGVSAGSMYHKGGSAELKGGEIRENEAYSVSYSGNQEGYGGGVFVWYGSADLCGTTIKENKANGWGGALFVQSGSATIKDTIMTGNTADIGGSGMNVYDGTVSIESLTFDDGEISCGAGSLLTGLNNIHREGYCFAGWSDITDDTLYRQDKITEDVDSVNLKIQWGTHTYDSGVVTAQPTDTSEGERTYTCTACGETRTETVPMLTSPTTVEISDVDVPLAGPVLVKEVLEELYKHEGSPDGEDAEGEYDLAIAWAIENEIIDEEEVDVEEIVTVAVLRDILTNYIDFAGIEYTQTLAGEDDDVVVDCGDILTALFNADR